MNTFLKGDKVHSIAIGRKAAFDGTVVYVSPNYINVRCPGGRLWCRSASELTLIKDEPLADATTEHS